jgi:hypothetical protein
MMMLAASTRFKVIAVSDAFFPLADYAIAHFCMHSGCDERDWPADEKQLSRLTVW